MAFLLSFFTSKAGVLTLIGALVFGVITTQTVRLNHAKSELSDLKAANANAAQVVKAKATAGETITTASQASIADDRTKVRTLTKTLIQKVPEYVPADADRDCIVPVGWVRLYNARVSAVSESPGGPDGSASGVSLSTILETDLANLGTGYDWRAEALGWRTWYKAQAAAWNSKP